MSELTNSNELGALIRLLDEPNEHTFSQIRDKIFSYGPQAIPSLEHAWENSFDNLIQDRIENIIRKIQIEDLHGSILNWIEEGGRDLKKGFIYVSKYQYPDQDNDKISADIAHIVQDIWLELNNDLTALEKVKVINHILFDIHKYSANKSNFYAPENFFLKNLLETKKGNPISLGILYMIISSSLKIPIYGVNLPKHFILSYADEITELGYQVSSEEEVLFYINPFNKGAVFTRNEIDLYIKQLKIKPNNNHYKPCSNITILKRLFEELRFSFDKSGYPDKSGDIANILKLFKQKEL